MKKINLNIILSAALLFPAAAYAEVLSPEAALGRAIIGTRSAATDYSLTKTFNTAIGEPAMYLFNDHAATLIVSADDCAQPLLAILDHSFDADNTNPAFDYWMAEYARQIEWIRENPTKTAVPAKASVSRPDIKPLLTTAWNQDAPFNDLAPEKAGEKCYTGCVATAITQVMNYHQWPEKGSGSNSYVSSTNEFLLNSNFDDIAFDWNNMADIYNGNTTAGQNSAVANLMYAVGVAVNMDYGVDSQGGSGAFTENVPYALVKYFNYDKGAHVVYRDAMPYSDWEQFVYDQLALGPVYYAGSSDDGAHAYVCDGYSNGYFHINWGWGGYQDGYYLLTAMFPGSQQGAGGSTGSYDFDQMIVADIKKPQAESKVAPLMIYSWGNWLEKNGKTVDRLSINRTGKITITGWAQNRSIEPLSLTAGLQLESEDGVVAVLDAGHYDLNRYNPIYNNQDCLIYELTTSVPESIQNGKYIARPVYKIDGEEEWIPISILKAYHQAYLLDVTDTTITISNAEMANAHIDKAEFTSRTVAGKSIKMKTVISNDSDFDYESCIQMYVYDANYNEMAYGGRRFVIVPAGETLEFPYESNLIGDITPGKYSVWFADAFTGEWLGDGVDMNYEKAPAAPELEVQQFYFNGDVNDADNMKLDFTMMVKCNKGWFRDTIDVTIWTSPENGASGYYVTTATCNEFELEEGKQSLVTFHGEIPEPELGMRYIAGAWYGGNQISGAITFKILKSGVDDVEVSAEPVSIDIYTLSGVKVDSDMDCLPSGIYVIRTIDAHGNASVKKQIVR